MNIGVDSVGFFILCIENLYDTITATIPAAISMEL